MKTLQERLNRLSAQRNDFNHFDIPQTSAAAFVRAPVEQRIDARRASMQDYPWLYDNKKYA